MKILQLMVVSVASLCMFFGSTNMGICSGDDDIESKRTGITHRNTTYNTQRFGLVDQDEINESKCLGTGENSKRLKPQQRQFYPIKAVIGVAGFCVIAYEAYNLWDISNQIKAHEEDWDSDCGTYSCNAIASDNSDMNPIVGYCLESQFCIENVQSLLKECFSHECLALHKRGELGINVLLLAVVGLTVIACY